MTKQQQTQNPKYRRQKGKPHDRAFVVLDGQRLYLGRYDSPESHQRYHQPVAEWLANGRRLPVDPQQLTVVELCARFWRFAEQYYRKPDGRPTSSLSRYRMVLRVLRRLHGHSRVDDFGPTALRTVQAAMVEAGWSRGVVNQSVRLVRHVFRWGVSRELVAGTLWQGLQSVTVLRPAKGAFARLAAFGLCPKR